jgi:hypothetical protein
MAEHPLAHRKLRVTKLQRDPEGFWTARLSLGGVTRYCDLRYGSWQTLIGAGRNATRHVVLPEYATVLQQHVRRAERRERNGAGPATNLAGAASAGEANDTQRNDAQRKESAMPTATAEPVQAPTPSPARAGSVMSHIEKAFKKADGPMTAGQLVEAMPKSAFSAKAKAEPFYQVYGRLSAGVKAGKVVKVDKGLFDLAELNPKGNKKRPAA